MKVKGFFARSTIAVCFLLAGCNLAQPQVPDYPGGPAASFDAPLPNSAYPPGPVHIVAHGSDPGGVSQFELTVNGSPATIPSPDTTNSLVTLAYDWMPPQPGTYPLQLRARNMAGEWSPYADTVVVIVEEAAATATSTPAPAFIERVRASSHEVYYGLPSMLTMPCGTKTVTLQFQATDPGGIQVVVLFYRLQSQSSGEMTEFASQTMVPIGQNLYQAALTPESLFPVSLIQSYGESWLQYQAVIQNNADEASARTEVFSDLALKVCTR